MALSVITSQYFLNSVLQKILSKLLGTVFTSVLPQSFSEHSAPLRILNLVTCLEIYYPCAPNITTQRFIDGRRTKNDVVVSH